MDASLPGFVMFRHFEIVRKMVLCMPGWLTRLTNPALRGLVDLQELLEAQVNEVVRNPASLQKTSHATIYHRLMDHDINKAAGVPSPGSLYEEAQALFFGGAESAANTTMIGIFHILQQPAIHKRLLEELRTVWSQVPKMKCLKCSALYTDLEAMDNMNMKTGNFECQHCNNTPLSLDDHTPPSIEQLERLPFLTAIIKESLRLAPGVPAPLPRVIPSSGATISNKQIPPGTIVGMSHLFVHLSPLYYPSPEIFSPDRWLQSDSAALEKWLVAFSRGPRACLGTNLGMCEMYFAFAVLFWRFDMKLDGTKIHDLRYRECFLPHFEGKHMRSFCKPAVRL